MLTVRHICAFCLLLIAHTVGYPQAPQIVVQTGHTSFVKSIAFSPDGRVLASGSKDQTIKLWEVSSGRLLFTFTQPAEVWAVAFNPDGRFLASGDSNGKVRLWDARAGTEVLTLSEQKSPVYAVAFSPDGKMLAAGNWDKTVTVWRFANGPDNLSVTSKPRATLTLKGHADNIMSVAFSPDGKLLASGSGGLGEDNTIKLWDTASGRQLRTLTGHTDDVNALAFSPDGQTLVSGSADKSVRLWNLKTGRVRQTLLGHSSSVESVAFGRNGMLASVGENIRLWDTKTGETSRVLPHMGRAVAFAPDGVTLANVQLYWVELWDVQRREVVRRLTGRTFPVNSVAYSPDGQTLASAGDDLYLWDMVGGQRVAKPGFKHPLARAVTFSPDGHTLTSGGLDGVIKLWDVKTGRELRTLRAGGDQVNCLVFSPDGKMLASGSGSVPMSDLPAGTQPPTGRITLWDVTTGRQLHELPGDALYGGSIAFSPDGKIVASGAGRDTINLWDVNSGREVSALKGCFLGTESVAFSPDGATLSSGHDDEIFVWDVRSGRLVRALGGQAEGGGDVKVEYEPELAPCDHDTPPGFKWVMSLAYSPDGSLLAGGSLDRTVKIWEPASGRLLRTLRGHDFWVNSVAFRPNGLELASGSQDAQVKLWDVRSGREKVSLIGVGEGQWLAVAPSGLFDGKADAMRQVSWRFGDIDPLNVVSFDTFFTDYFYPGLLSDIAKGDNPAPRLDLAAQLRLPSLRTMLLQGMARIEKRDGKTVLCLSQKPTARTLLVEDGLPTPLAPEDFTYEEDDPSCPHRKELAGDKQYEAINAAAGATRPMTEPVYNGQPSDTSLSTLHVLTVAVDKYDFTTSGFKPLLSSVSGAKEIEKFFAGQKQGGGPYHEVRVWDGLFDGAATREAIRGRLAEMAAVVKEDDVVFLFFSGHGIVPVGQEMFYFAPADMRGPDPLLNRETGLNAAMLAEALREMPARRIVLVIDSCQSGGVIESLSKVGELKAKSVEQRLRADNKAAGGTGGMGVYIIASATPLQEALQPVKGYGALVSALLDALRGAPRDGEGNISIRAVTQHVKQKFATEAADADTAHTPMVYASGVNYPIVKYRE